MGKFFLGMIAGLLLYGASQAFYWRLPPPPNSCYIGLSIQNKSSQDLLVAVIQVNDRRFLELNQRELCQNIRDGRQTEVIRIVKGGESENIIMPSQHSYHCGLLGIFAQTRLKEDSFPFVQKIAFSLVPEKTCSRTGKRENSEPLPVLTIEEKDLCFVHDDGHLNDDIASILKGARSGFD